MTLALLEWVNRLVDWFRPDRALSPQEVFQFRFLVGSALLGILVAVFSLIGEVLLGLWLSALVILVFGASLLALLIALRAGVALPTMSWYFLALLGLFFLGNALLMAQFHENQLRWLVLLPMVSMVIGGSGRTPGRVTPPMRAVGTAACMAIVLGTVIVVAHDLGWTLGLPEPPSTSMARSMAVITDYLFFVISVTGLLWVYGQALRKTQEELHILRQMLSVCAWCKRIHDAEDGWISMEHHLGKHSGTGLTHGICPDCARTVLHDLVKPPGPG